MTVKLRKGPSGPLAGGSPTGLNNLTATRFVDGATEVSGGDGNIETPFADLQSAIDDLAESGGGTIVVNPNFSSYGDITVPENSTYSFVVWSLADLQNVVIGAVEVGSLAAASFEYVHFAGDASIGEGGTLNIFGSCNVGNITSSGEASNVTISGVPGLTVDVENITAKLVSLSYANIVESVTSSDTVRLTGCTYGEGATVDTQSMTIDLETLANVRITSGVTLSSANPMTILGVPNSAYWTAGGGTDGQYMRPFGDFGSPTSPNIAVGAIIAPNDCILRNLTLVDTQESSTAPTTFTVLVDGTPSPVTVTIPNGVHEATDSSHSVQVSRGQKITILTNTATVFEGLWQASLQMT